MWEIFDKCSVIYMGFFLPFRRQSPTQELRFCCILDNPALMLSLIEEIDNFGEVCCGVITGKSWKSIFANCSTLVFAGRLLKGLAKGE